jgi:hypothetical protein
LDDRLVADWFVADWLVADWVLDPDRSFVAATVAVSPAVVMRTVKTLVRAVWLLVRACWFCRICCCVGTPARAPRQALIAAPEGGLAAGVVVGVVSVALLGPEPLVDSSGVVPGPLVEDEKEESFGVGLDPDPDGKNGAHRARAEVACRRSVAIVCWALVTRFWAVARPWLVDATDRPDELARGLAPGVVVALAFDVAGRACVAARAFVVLVVVVGLWSDSRVALALARDARAAVTALRSGAGSRVARV